MKKTMRVLSLVLCLVLAVTIFAGCSAKYKSVGDYLLEDEVQASLDEEVAALEGSGVSMTVYADGNTLVYDCKYDEQLDLSDEEFSAAIVAALEEACVSEDSTAIYTDILDSLRVIIDADDICVRLIYRNADDSVIYSHDYK